MDAETRADKAENEVGEVVKFQILSIGILCICVLLCVSRKQSMFDVDL